MGVRGSRARARVGVGLALALLSACPHPPPPPPVPASDRCDPLRPVAPREDQASPRVIALVVGVSRYQSPEVKPLRGATLDAEAMYALLTGRLGLAADDVCLLTDEEASAANVKAGFETFLEDRARPGDEVIFFFAGHGSTAYDLEREEADGWDSTLVLNDSRVGDVTDLRDDDLAALLAGVQQKTSAITLLLDACHSGTAARLLDRSRSVDAAPRDQNPDRPGRAGSRRQLVSGVTVLAAADDLTLALEPRGGDHHGYFTAGLLAALEAHADDAVSWGQIFEEAEASVKGRTRSQVPFAEGGLERVALRPGEVRAADAQRQERAAPPALSVQLTPADPGAPPFPVCDGRVLLPRGARWTVSVTNDGTEALRPKGAVVDPCGGVEPLPANDLAQELGPHSAMNLDPDQVLRVEGEAGGRGEVVVVAAQGRAPPRLGTARDIAGLPEGAAVRVPYLITEDASGATCDALTLAPDEATCCQR